MINNHQQTTEEILEEETNRKRRLIKKENESIERVKNFQFTENLIEILKNKFNFLKEENPKFIIHEEKPSRKNQEKACLSSIFNRISGKLEFTVHLSTHKSYIRNNYLKIRFEEFLEGQGLKINPKSMMVIIALHEIGHLCMHTTLMNKYEKDYFSVRSYLSLEKNALNVLFSSENQVKALMSGEELYYNFSMSELYADNFVFKHFASVWKEIN